MYAVYITSFFNFALFNDLGEEDCDFCGGKVSLVVVCEVLAEESVGFADCYDEDLGGGVEEAGFDAFFEFRVGGVYGWEEHGAVLGC